MANAIDIHIRAHDETTAAYNAAEKRMGRFQAATGSADKQLSGFVRTNSNVRIAADGVRNALSGNIAGLDNFAQSLAMINPQLVKLAGGLTALAIGAQIGTQLDKSFGLSDRIAALINNVDPSEIESGAQAVDRKIREMENAMRRFVSESDAASAAKLARIGAEVEGPAAGVLQAIERAKRESERVTEQVMAAENKVGAARERLGAEEGKSAFLPKESGGQDLDKIRKLREEYKAAVMDLDSAAGVAKSKQAEIDATLGATLRNARKQIVEMERDLARAVETQHIEAFERVAAKAAAEVERIGTAIKDMADPRLRALAAKAIAAPPEKAGAVDIAGGQAQRDLERRKQELAQIDELGAMQRAKTDRGEKARVREVEKQRDKTENELKRATERAAQGRKLTTREKDLLQEFDAVAGKKGGAIRAQKEAAENARVRKETQEQANAVKAGLDTSETAKRLIELLQASRR
jgi:hypothetical protein